MTKTQNGALHATGAFNGGGLQLFCQSWQPQVAARAQVILVHGFGEHSDRYGTVVSALTRSGYGVHAYDTRGHGRSPGQRGHINNWKEYREDLGCFIRHVQHRFPAKPFLYGHSLGALMVLDYLLHGAGAVAGAVISGAPIEPAGVAKPWLLALARICSRWLPWLPAPVPIKRAQLSRDPAVLAAHAQDRLINFQGTARWATESLATIKRVKTEGKKLQLPLLFLHGAADSINTAAGAEAFARQLPTATTTWKVYPGGLHEPHNDVDREQVMQDVVEWLNRYSATSNA